MGTRELRTVVGALAGTYDIVFSVEDSVTHTRVNATRHVVVLPLCTSSEELCATRLCAPTGTCFSGRWINPTLVNAAPALVLRPVLSAPAGSAVLVPAGVTYAQCGLDLIPTSQLPCEPGARLYTHCRAANLVMPLLLPTYVCTLQARMRVMLRMET